MRQKLKRKNDGTGLGTLKRRRSGCSDETFLNSSDDSSDDDDDSRNEEVLACRKLVYASRTHSQLSQFMREVLSSGTQFTRFDCDH